MNQTMAARTITVDGKKYSVTLLPGTVHKTKKGGRYSSQKRYDCGAYKAFGGNNCLCNCFQAAKGCRQFRVKEVDSDNEAIDVFLCPNDELHLGLMTVEEDELESVLVPETQICHLPRPGGGTFQVCLLKGSCRAFAAELSSNDHLFVHRRQPPPGEEFLKHAEALFGVRHEGGRRGSEFFGTPNMGDCMHALRSIDECNEVLDDIEKADKCQIALILSVFYGMGNTANKKVNFILHADKPYYNKPPQRSNWTAYSNRDDEDEGDKMLRHLRNNSVMANGDGDDEEKASEEEDNKWDVQAIGKVMRFQCRETGKSGTHLQLR